MRNGLLAVAMLVTSTAAADTTVRLDPVSSRFDQRIPSSSAFTLDVPVPGKDLIRGELEVWPARAGECKPTSDRRQHYELAMVASGTDADRVLRATVPALQVDTRFCFGVRIARGLDDVAAVGISSSAVADVLQRIPLEVACRDVDALRSTLISELSAAVGRATSINLETRQLAVRSASPTSDAVGRAVVQGLDLQTMCSTVLTASGAAEVASKAAEQAKVDRAAFTALDPVKPVALLGTNLVKARLPLWVSGSGTTTEIRRFVDVLDQETSLAAAAQALEPISAELADLLRDMQPATADRKAIRAAFKAALAKRDPQPATLVYSSGGTLLQIALDDLFAPSAGPALAARRKILLENLDLLKRQFAAYALDDANAKPWLAALAQLHNLDLAYQAANRELAAKLDARDAARQAFATKLKERLVSVDVRGLVISVSTVQSAQNIAAPATDTGASSVAADIGVLFALPIGVDRNRDDYKPWLVPYAGVNIYASRVDRTVSFDELVGARWRQRMSLTLGALITRPDINGKSISMPFLDSGVVPVAAIGVRLTSFTRFTVGGFLFDYNDPNPATTTTHRAGAVWIGLSIDADVWAAIQGKAFQ